MLFWMLMEVHELKDAFEGIRFSGCSFSYQQHQGYIEKLKQGRYRHDFSGPGIGQHHSDESSHALTFVNETSYPISKEINLCTRIFALAIIHNPPAKANEKKQRPEENICKS